jgi:hypothetical protein
MRTFGDLRHPLGQPTRIPWNPAFVAVPIAVAAGLYGLNLGHDWRLIASVSPLDPTPARGMLLVAVVAATSMLGGLGLMTRVRGPIGAWVFAIGVALVCGVAWGFVTGPTAGVGV